MPTSPPLRSLITRLPIDPDAPPPSTRPLRPSSLLVLVASGGVVGSLARASIANAFPHASGSWAWSTIDVNLLGSAVLAFVLVFCVERFPSSRVLRPLIGTGMLGGFTTFSTFAMDAVQMIEAHRPILALGYILTSVAGGIVAALVGLSAARAFDRLVDQERWTRRVRHHLARTEEQP